MKYRLEVLTPTLVGDGDALSPIDYMVWKDQVNVLDQERIFRLLARGPRLDGYLNQIKKAEKLDFPNWGGFAQNYAGRRIPFEDPSCAPQWQKQRAEHCHIPTFARGVRGPFVPGSAIRGALRTAFVASRIDEKTLAAVEQALGGDRPTRRPAEACEHRALSRDGRPGTGDQFKSFAVSDSSVVDSRNLIVYMIRTATLLEDRQTPAKFALGWKTAGRGSVEARRIDESTPAFAEMARPGTVVEGNLIRRAFFSSKDAMTALHWKRALTVKVLCEAANSYAAIALANHGNYAKITGMGALLASVETLLGKLDAARRHGNACLLAVGWGTGLLGKSAWPKVEDESYRRVMSKAPFYARAIKTGFPFPKTRRVAFLGGQPAALPGWIWLEVDGDLADEGVDLDAAPVGAEGDQSVPVSAPDGDSEV
jgi:CRISPR-associated protein Csm5